ncbi:hypothetical protein PCANB_002022 [Pneumocystis canis]|nr:hypothetical protein PCANB_002022 [Pneumocystis canis]
MSSIRFFYAIFNKFRLGTAINVKPVSDFDTISPCKKHILKENKASYQKIKEDSESTRKKNHSCSFLIRLIIYIGSFIIYIWNKLKNIFVCLFFIRVKFFWRLHNNSAPQSWLNIFIYLFFLPYFWITNGKRLTKFFFPSKPSSEKYRNFKSTHKSLHNQLSLQSPTSKPEHSIFFDSKKPLSKSIHDTLYNKDIINKNNVKSPTSSPIVFDVTQWSNFSYLSMPRPLFPKTLIPKTLILDLDETLIHSLLKGGRITSGHMVEVMLGKHAILYYVHKRPHCDSFLKKVSKWYNVVIFTASVQEYADPVIDWLEQGRKLFKARFYRQHCTFHNGAYIKDLSIVQPDLSKAIIIDNSPVSYSLHRDNAIPIQGWISDPSDKNLLHLIPFLHGLRYVLDVRTLLGLRSGMFSFNS